MNAVLLIEDDNELRGMIAALLKQNGWNVIEAPDGEAGISLARHCARYLDDAERRIEMLVKDEGGATVTKPFVFEAEDEA